MARLERRLRKLEEQFTDSSGRVPHTKAWLDYWTPIIMKMATGEPLDQKIPLQVIDAFVSDDFSAHGS